MKLQEKQKNQSGITLVALVVTIIILIILATISIRMVIGEGGLIWQANNAKVEYRAAEVDEEVLAWKAEKQMAKYTDGITPQGRDALIEDQLKRGLLTQEEADTAKRDGQVKIGSRTIHYGEDTQTDQSDEPQTPPEKDLRPLVNDLTDLQPSTVEARDLNGNSVVMPGKFKFAGGKTDTVENGIIIEDGDGNQFVWIPVSNIDGTNDSPDEKEIIKNDKSTVTITLGRYTFNTSNGESTLAQKGSQYAEEAILKAYDFLGGTVDYTELNNSREAFGTGDKLGLTTDVNATAKDLKAFVESAKKNHGYYIGRYEASYGSGISFGAVNENVTEPEDNWYKPLVQKSIQYHESGDTFTPPTETEQAESNKGTLWNYITQGNASKVCRNMYNGNDDESQYVESDLVNSYMWDTAIVYIQAMENSNYANQKGQSINSSLTNTGTNTNDEKCHVCDMAGNLYEWTTEYSPISLVSVPCRCVFRGSFYNDTYGNTAYRNQNSVTFLIGCGGFRPGLYIKGNPEN